MAQFGAADNSTLSWVCDEDDSGVAHFRLTDKMGQIPTHVDTDTARYSEKPASKIRFENPGSDVAYIYWVDGEDGMEVPMGHCPAGAFKAVEASGGQIFNVRLKNGMLLTSMQANGAPLQTFDIFSQPATIQQPPPMPVISVVQQAPPIKVLPPIKVQQQAPPINNRRPAPPLWDHMQSMMPILEKLSQQPKKEEGQSEPPIENPTVDVDAPSESTPCIEEGNLAAANYGTTETVTDDTSQKIMDFIKVSMPLLVLCLGVPVLVFLLNCFMMGFAPRYWTPFLAYAVPIIVLLGCLVIGVVAALVAKDDKIRATWLGILFLFSLMGWLSGFLAGEQVYTEYMLPHFDLLQMNVYQDLDPSKVMGNQYMDFGIVSFIDNATINQSFTMSFRNGVTYCVAPVTVNGTRPSSYDFWAVGIDCCSSKSFFCGDWNLKYAHSGLRVSSESQRQFYQVAVRKAISTYDIPAYNPIFFEWAADPSGYINALTGAGVRMMLDGALKLFCVELMLVLVAASPVVWAQTFNEASKYDWSVFKRKGPLGTSPVSCPALLS